MQPSLRAMSTGYAGYTPSSMARTATLTFTFVPMRDGGFPSYLEIRTKRRGNRYSKPRARTLIDILPNIPTMQRVLPFAAALLAE